MTSQPVSNQASASPAPSQSLIYIVDDEPMLVDLAELVLKPDGYQIKKFYAPELALKSFLAESVLPTFLITDYAMGAMTGLDLAVACKQRHPNLKIIMLSGTAGPDIIVDAPVKIDRFIAKPYHANTLLQSVRTLLED